MHLTRFARAAALAPLALILPATAWGQIVETRQEERDSADQLDEIIVTARSLARPDTKSLPVKILVGDELAHRRQGGLGETLEGLPGVHLDNFGGGASRPVIRGQTLPRIEILSDGAALFNAASESPDHAITADPLLLDGIEILRGPATAIYGGNALNGAINLIDSKVPKSLPIGGLIGATEVRYGTGDEEKTVVGRVTGAIGQFAVHAEGSRRIAEDYDVPNAFGTDKLKDSFARNSTYAFGGSWVGDRGYVGAVYTRQDATYGLPGHSHANAACHNHSVLLHCELHDGHVDPFAGFNDADTAKIRLRSERIDARADFDDLLPGFAHVRARFSYTDYRHDEIDGPIIPSRYLNEAYDGRLELTHRPLLGFIGTLGGQYTRSTFRGLNQNALHLGPGGPLDLTFLSKSYSIFLTERQSFGPFDIEVGARKDWRNARATTHDFDFLAGPSKASPFSASIGAVWNAGLGYALSLNLTRSQRAPGLRELYAFGNNLATNSYEIGLISKALSPGGLRNDADLLETAKSINLTLRKSSGSTRFEVSAFHQNIDNYVYAKLLDQDATRNVRLLLYTPADVTFTGIDGEVSHRFDAGSTVTVFGDYVRTRLKSEDDRLPRIPPGRLGARYAWAGGPVSADLEYYHTFAQNRVASYETRTPGYEMLNATLAYRFDLGALKSVEFYARGTNLTNELAFSHTSFVKFQSPLRGRNVVIGMRHQF